MLINTNYKPSEIKKLVIERIELQGKVDAVKPMYRRIDEIDAKLGAIAIRKRAGKLVITTMFKVGKNVIRFVPNFIDAKKDLFKPTAWKATASRAFAVTID